MARIAFIGLGNMGLPMAANLVKSKNHVTGYDLVSTACDAAASAGIVIAESAAQAASEAEIVITMLPFSNHVRTVWTEILPHVGDGTTMIDCSTVDVATAVHTHEMAAERKLACLDAPVSGGVNGAQAATLTFMVGGNQETFHYAKPIILAMGKKIVNCGAAGMGQAAKICNNMVAAVSMIGVCEAFLLAEKLGLSKEALFDVASKSSGQSWSLTNYCPAPGPVPTAPSNHDYQPGFMADLMLKDLKLAQSAAQSTSTATTMGAQATALLQLYVNKGHGKKDFSGIFELISGKV
jgi:3-hydroxyisobutyrate dehydrogenase